MHKALVVAALATCSCLAQRLEVDLVAESLIKSRLESGVVGARQREAAIRDLFTDSGCVPEQQRINKGSGNVICTLQGETASTIVVGGHFDFADRGKGIVDDWSGASLLASLFQSLKSRPRRHTIVFVAFAAEERGLIGSSFYVKNLVAEQKALIRAFVNLECLGLAPPEVWINRSSLPLVARLREVAAATKIPIQGVNVDKVGDDDTRSFLGAKISVISIHSLTQETLPILHSVSDGLDAIHFDDYYTAYKLVAFYLAYLDVKTQ